MRPSMVSVRSSACSRRRPARRLKRSRTHTGVVRAVAATVSVSKPGSATVTATGVATVDPAAAASGDATCVLDEAGALAGGGDNSDGEAPPPAGAFTGLSMTWNHGCALATDGTVTCWGRD